MIGSELHAAIDREVERVCRNSDAPHEELADNAYQLAIALLRTAHMHGVTAEHPAYVCSVAAIAVDAILARDRAVALEATERLAAEAATRMEATRRPRSGGRTGRGRKLPAPEGGS